MVTTGKQARALMLDDSQQAQIQRRRTFGRGWCEPAAWRHAAVPGLADRSAAGDFHDAVRGGIAAVGRCACTWDLTGTGDAGVDRIHGEDTRRVCEVVI